MMTYDVVYVPFPFSDLSISKKRPCVILGSFRLRSYNQQLVVAMITSKVSHVKFPHDVSIEDLEAAGLPVASIIRLSKIVTIDSGLVVKKLGRIASREHVLMKREFKLLFKDL